MYVAFSAVKPAASAHVILDTNSGAVTIAIGAGSTSISNGPALNGRPQESSPLYLIVIYPPHESYSETKFAVIDPEISQVPSNPFVYVASSAVKPAASAHDIRDGNSGVVISASGAGNTSIITLALNGFSQES